MKRLLTLFLLAVMIVPLVSSQSFGSPFELKKSRQVAEVVGNDLVVSVRLIGGKGAVLNAGRNISITFQTNMDAYVVLYNIDSEGYVHLLYPDNGKPARVKGRKVYFLPEAGSGVYWEVGDKTGIEYIHAFAVTDRDMIKEEELYFLAQSRKLAVDKQLRIDMDPFLAFNMIDEEVLADAQTADPATDYTYFYINQKVDYPRYLCVKCHGTDDISDPYAMECPEIVIERAAYEEDLHYPYPEIFQVRHVGEEEEDYYTSTEYAEKVTDEWDEDNDTDVHLSIYYSDDDYPYRYYYPHYRYYVSYHYPYYWDWYWWDFGWSFYWGDVYYYHWPFYSWYRPYYWAYYYWHPYRWYHWDHCYNYNYAHRHRGIHQDRFLSERRLRYASTVSRLRRKEAVASSRLMRKRFDTAERTRINQSRLAKSRLADRARQRETAARVTRYRNDRTSVRNRDIERRVVHGRDRIIQTKPTRDERRSREVRESRVPRVRKDSSGRGTVRSRERSTKERDSERSVKGSSSERKKSRGTTVRKSTPQKSTRSVKKPAKRERSSSRSSSTKSRSIRRSSSSSRSTAVRRSSPQRSSAPARSSGTRSSPSRSSGSRSSGGGSRSRRK
jgi:hypothetical protein